MQLVPSCRLSAVQVAPPESLAMCQDAEDAESCCGSPVSFTRGPDHWAQASSQQARWGSVQPPGAHCSLHDSCHRHQQLDSFPCFQHSSECGTTGATSACTQGDDFEALEPSMLLEDPCFDTYPGGVEAALADWRAAVSSKAQSPSPGSATAEASSSCCNYIPHHHHQQQQQIDPLAWERLLLGGWTPDMFRQAAVHVTAAKQQLPELQQQHMCAVPPQQHPQQPGAVVAAAAAVTAAKRQQLQALLQQQQQQQRQQQWRAFSAFEGDVVGAVLAGVMPAPSCDSNNDFLGPLALDLPCC